MKKSIFYICSMFVFVLYTLSCGVIQNKVVLAESDIKIDTSAKSCLIMDYNTNTIIYENNSNARLPIASMVKLMTILLRVRKQESFL